MATDMLAGLHAKYLKTTKNKQNPVYAWKAFQVAREFSVPIPGWVLTYFDDCGRRLVNGDEPAAALDFAVDGGHGKVVQAKNESRDVWICSRIDVLRGRGLTAADYEDGPPDPSQLRGESKLDKIFETVAAETADPDSRYPGKAVSAKTVRDIYYRLKD